VKVAGGRGVKALPRCMERVTRRRRSPGGARIGRGLNNLGRHRTHRGEQGPEGEGAVAGHRRLRSTARGHETAGETRNGSVERDKPLEGKPWTWLRGETNPRRLVAEQTVEDVRNVEDGP